MGETLAAVTGFSSGFIVAGGVVALMVGLGIITRFIGISHTAAHIRAGENAILFGTVVGTILTVYEVSLPLAAGCSRSPVCLWERLWVAGLWHWQRS